MVLVPTTVMDRRGALVTGLAANSFQVSQDNTPQRIVSFGEEDVPAAVGVVFDTSGSMRSVLGTAKTTLRSFFNSANPRDEACLYAVTSRPQKDSGFTGDFSGLLEHMMFFDAGGSTALVDSIYSAMDLTRKAHLPRKALLVISDGMDNHSRYSKNELIAVAMESDLQIYSISIFDPPRNKKPVELAEERNGVLFLEELTRRTGGVQIVVRDASDIDRAAADIGRAIRDQYLIGYIPQSTDRDGKWHSVKVKLSVAGAKAYARAGFYGN